MYADLLAARLLAMGNTPTFYGQCPHCQRLVPTLRDRRAARHWLHGGRGRVLSGHVHHTTPCAGSGRDVLVWFIDRVN